MASTNLGRPAVGLPRYYMDCGWYRHPAFAGLPIASLFLFEAIVGYCTEHATDGVVPADIEDLAVALGLRYSDVASGLDPLIERQRIMFNRTSGVFVVPDWSEHNPTKADIEDLTESRSSAGSYGNHVRWHVERDRPDPACGYCADPAIAPDRKSIANHRKPEICDPVCDSQTPSPPDSDPKGDKGSSQVRSQVRSQTIANGIARKEGTTSSTYIHRLVTEGPSTGEPKTQPPGDGGELRVQRLLRSLDLADDQRPRARTHLALVVAARPAATDDELLTTLVPA